MNITLTTGKQGKEDFSFLNPNDIWLFIANKISSVPAPDIVTVNTPFADAEFQIVKKKALLISSKRILTVFQSLMMENL